MRRSLREHYAVGVDAHMMVMVLDKQGRRRDERLSAKQLALRIEAAGGFRRTTWRQGTKRPLTARFAVRRVIWAGKPGREQRALDEREPEWLLIEWRDGEPEPANYFFCSLPEAMTGKSSSGSSRSAGERSAPTRTSRASSASTTTKAGGSPAGTTTSRSSSPATRSSSRSARGVFPPRPEGRWPTSRSRSRPERHFHDSFVTVRLAIARAIARWLPRCPVCPGRRPRGERRPLVGHPT